jgi:hypothetical protein
MSQAAIRKLFLLKFASSSSDKRFKQFDKLGKQPGQQKQILDAFRCDKLLYPQVLEECYRMFFTPVIWHKHHPRYEMTNVGYKYVCCGSGKFMHHSFKECVFDFIDLL